jgi:hypothetical protein
MMDRATVLGWRTADAVGKLARPPQNYEARLLFELDDDTGAMDLS